MGKIMLAVLCLTIGVATGVWNGSLSEVVAQSDCSDVYAEPPFSPNTPEKLVGFRSLVESGTQSKERVTLHWVNEAADASCFVVQVSFSNGQAADGWTPLETIFDPAANQYRHMNLPSSGEVCCRVYAANQTARSNFSNRVCLELGVPIPPSTVVAPNTPNEEVVVPEESSGLQAWHLIIIVLAIAAVGVVGAVAMWRYKGRRSRVEAG